MPPFDWSQLVNHSQWAQKLDELLSRAHAALTKPVAGERAAGIQDSVRVLQAFIANEPGFINDLLQVAKSAIIDLAITDIGEALGRLTDLQNQLHGIIRNEFHAQRFTAPELLPRRRLAQAFYALTALQKQQAGIVSVPEQNPAMNKQISDLLSTLQHSLNQPPPTPTTPAKVPARSSDKAKPSKR